MSKFSIMSLKWIYNYLHKFYEYLEVNEKRMLIFLLIVCLLTQLPKAYLAYGYGESAHPGFDSALVFNGAENIKENGKYEYSVLLRYDDYDSLERHEITKPAYFYPPLTSLLLAGILFFNDSIFATEVFQFFIFFLVIIVYFKLVKNWFDQKTAFFSAILIITNPLISAEIFSPVRTHILSLLLIISFFYILTIKKNFKNFNFKIFSLGLICGLSYLTRDVNLLIFMIFTLFLLYKQEIRKLLVFIITFMIIVLPWWVRNFAYYGTINPRGKIVQYDYPAVREMNTGLDLINFGNIIESFWFFFGRFLRDLASLDMFYVFTPFVIIGLLYSSFVIKKHNLVIAYCFSLIMLYCSSPTWVADGSYFLIYFVPVIVMLYPFGIYLILAADDILISDQENNKQSLLLVERIKTYKNIVFSFLIVLTLVASSVTIANDTRSAYNESNAGDDKHSIFQWAIENIPEDKKVAVANTPGYLPIHLAYYSGLETITIPVNLDDYWLEIFLRDYKISFIFIHDTVDPDCIYDKSISPYKEIFSANDKITFGEINLNLVFSDSEGISIYEVEITNKDT